MRSLIFLIIISVIVMPALLFGNEKADKILVVKSESKVYLLKAGQPLYSFRAAFGANPKGHKRQEGDERTPEGRYVIDYKKADSAFYKALHISYPNAQDKQRARQAGLSPGGYIMIHGQKNGYGWLSLITQRFNWTDGCIAVSNSAMDQIWNAVDVGTPIEIRP